GVVSGSYVCGGIEDEGLKAMAAWRRAIELSLGDADVVEVDSAVANRTGEPGRAGADSVGVSGRPVVFCGRPSARPPSSDRPALRRTGRGRRPDGSAGRSPAPWQGADDHHGSKSMADVAGLPEGEGTGLSA